MAMFEFLFSSNVLSMGLHTSLPKEEIALPSHKESTGVSFDVYKMKRRGQRV